MRMMRGRPATVSWLSASPGSLAIISARCSVGAQFAGGHHDRGNEQIVEAVGGLDLAGEECEELLELTHPQRVEQHVLAAGEESVQRGPRHAALGGDVVDRDLGESPTLAARLGSVEDSPLRLPGQLDWPACLPG